MAEKQLSIFTRLTLAYYSGDGIKSLSAAEVADLAEWAISDSIAERGLRDAIKAGYVIDDVEGLVEIKTKSELREMLKRIARE